MIGLATSASLALVGLLSTAASAAVRGGSDLHPRLAAHLASTSAAPSGSVLTNSNIMAAVVGLLALMALAFMIVTFIRRQPRDV
jgi:hypothetical protein